jgi:prepilin-type N-terminal cleavage/methylation domain-containing protein
VIGEKPTRSGFTLTEILIVVAIIAALAAIVLPQLIRSGETGESAKTDSRIKQIEIAIGTYNSKHGDSPPSRLKSLGIVKNNGVNEGAEALVLALAREDKGVPTFEWASDWLENSDGDELTSVPKDSFINSKSLYEPADHWGNPIVYIHHSDYGKRLQYKDAEGAVFQVTAQKSKKLGKYHHPTSYQMWSFGPDRKNDNGKGDDVANFVPDDEED